MVARALGRGEQHPPDQTQRRKLDLRWNEECCQRPLKVNASSAHIESESSAHIANESSAHRETASSAHKERSSAHIEAGNQPFLVWLGGVGWGGMITFMFLCTHRHSNLIIFLPVEQRQAQLFHDQLPVGWGELIRFMFLCLHTHSNLIIFLVR